MNEIIDTDLPPVLDYLEPRVGELGDFSIAHVALGAHLGGLAFAQIPIDAERWPAVARFYDETAARPSFQKAMQMAGL